MDILLCVHRGSGETCWNVIYSNGFGEQLETPLCIARLRISEGVFACYVRYACSCKALCGPLRPLPSGCPLLLLVVVPAGSARFLGSVMDVVSSPLPRMVTAWVEPLTVDGCPWLSVPLPVLGLPFSVCGARTMDGLLGLEGHSADFVAHDPCAHWELARTSSDCADFVARDLCARWGLARTLLPCPLGGLHVSSDETCWNVIYPLPVKDHGVGKIMTVTDPALRLITLVWVRRVTVVSTFFMLIALVPLDWTEACASTNHLIVSSLFSWKRVRRVLAVLIPTMLA